MYPYLVDSNAKTGGGDVPEFNWNIIEDGKSFEVLGIQITPLPVYHGKFFDQFPEKPYICLSYLIERSIYYVSDVSEIPQNTVEFLKNKFKSEDDRLKILILDTLNIYGHPPHFGISQSVRAAKILNPHRTYLVGFTHRVSHDCWVYCCKAISAGKKSVDFSSEPNYSKLDFREVVAGKERRKLFENGILEDFDWFTHQSLTFIEQSESEFTHDHLHPSVENSTDPCHDYKSKLVWIRPGFDGLLIQTTDDPLSISDNFY